MDDETRAQALTAALHDIIDAWTLEEAAAIARRAVSWTEERVLAAHDAEVGRVAAEKALREEAAILHAGDTVWAHKAAEHLIARISHRTLDGQETTT